jgi:tetratricopeptide (TPR) repeat protein/SAM-dependent methyltransferase
MGLLRNALSTIAGMGKAADRASQVVRETLPRKEVPRHFEARSLADAGRLVEAIAACAKTLDEESANGWVNRAYVLRVWGRLHEADRAIEQALSVAQHDPDALSLAALIAIDRRQFARAEQMLRDLRGYRTPTRSDALAWAVALGGLGRHGEAADAIRDLPDTAIDADLSLTLAECEIARGVPNEAERLCRNILARQPEHARALAVLAVACSMQDKKEEARSLNALAVEASGGQQASPTTLTNRAIAEFDLGNIELATAMLEASLPDHPDINGLLALGPALLAQGRFKAGWRMYEYRWLSEPLASIRPRLDIPQWRGQPLDGDTILVRSEQGIGDVVQFARYLPMLKARGATVHFQPLRDMARFAERFRGVDHIVLEGERLADAAYYVNLLSMPLAFDTTLQSIPSDVPYLAPSPEYAERWSSHFSDRRKPLVGLAWAGSPKHRRDRQRSLKLEQLGPILRVPGIRFVSLQKGPAAHQAPPIIAGLDWEDVGPLSLELDDALAIVNELDLLICVDTALAHIAGALGKAAWVLNALPADFRWLLDTEYSPWYPTLRLFRQATTGHWSPVIERVAAELAAWSRPPRSTTAARNLALPRSASDRDDVERLSGLPFPAETRAGFIEYPVAADDVSRAVDYYGEWQQDALDCLATLLRIGDSVLCAGARFGLHALQIARALGSNGHVLAAESDERMFRLLQRNVARFDSGNVTVLVNDGTKPVPATRVGGASIDELGAELISALHVTLPADAMALVDGGTSTIWRDRPVLSFECPSADALRDWSRRLLDLGYRCFALDRPHFRANNFNRRREDRFDGRRYLYLFGVPEERGVSDASMQFLQPIDRAA